MQSLATSLPVISSSQNGPGTADVDTTFFDTYAEPIWHKDADGFLDYTAYDIVTGAVTKSISDVDTTKTSDFQNLPTGWVTPSGGGLHLITQMQDDGLGRTTKLTDPDGNITYTVYNDPNLEVRVYAGWQSATNTTTGPTEVSRRDRNGSYTEMLTMTATPAVSSGVPTGTESVSNLQTLSRDYVNSAGQMVRSDAYFSFSGLTYSTSNYPGTVNTNYYTTLEAYDLLGRENRTQAPTGTISRTAYDDLDREVSTWVGTNDSVSGVWSPSNNGSPSNMVQLTANSYDAGGVGDSNLTEMDVYPGGSAATRVTESFFDWRDRLVASKDGVQGTEDTSTHRPILYTDYDNLDEATAVSQYDGDGVSITSSSGVPNKPSSSLLRAYDTTSYDDQGRIYVSQVYSVNQSTGAVSSNSLSTNTWYDHRGEVIKVAPPGGLVVKDQYDGAGRLTKEFESDGGGDSGWSDAGNVTGDNVLQQDEYQYDSNGNVIVTLQRQRFHDDTHTGALGNTTTYPLARVYYATAYYDAADRLTSTVDVGTNGGSAYTRPSSVPSRSDTVLVTSNSYNDAGWLFGVTDPRGILSNTYYDALGRVTKTIQDYATRARMAFSALATM